MKSRIYIFITLTVTSLWFMQSCSKKVEQTQLKAEKLALPENPDEYYFNSILQNKQATIGRALFYDKNLSANNVIACASCHFQENAFADGKQFSTGFKTEMTNRNSMAFNNLSTNNNDGGFFWDLRETNLQEMVLKPVSNHIEMGFTDITLICKKLAQFPHYKKLFDEAYDDGLTMNNVASSLKLFLTAIKSENSKFDIGFKQSSQVLTKDFPNFTTEENYGKQIFMKDGCGNCHNPASNFQKGWSNWGNIGLDLNYVDKGISQKFIDEFGNEFNTEGNFKIPSLRNIALTAPYMHDGRFATLNDVLNHYSEGIKKHKNLSWELTETVMSNGVLYFVPKRFNYSEQDKQALIAFLKTLTDYKMVNDNKFSNPFQIEN